MSNMYLLLLAAVLASVVANPVEKVKRQIPGGVNESDPNNSQFLELARESYQEYRKTHPHSVADKKIEVTKASTQVVAGAITRIDFTVFPTTGDSFNCHSEVLEPVGKKNKQISVNCIQ